MLQRPRVFLDTETTGLAVRDQIWEFAALRQEVTGELHLVHRYVEHSLERAKNLPQSFREDHDRRYDHKAAVNIREAAKVLADVLNPGRPHIYGVVPDFDLFRIRRILKAHDHESNWHYHLKDIENMAVGYLYGLAKVHNVSAIQAIDSGMLDNSNYVSAAIGVDPNWFDRHTAIGDVAWGKAMVDMIETGKIEPFPGD